MGKTSEILAPARDGAREILSLAFFFFAAIAAERLFVARVASFAGPGPTLPLTAAIVAASIVGFFLRPYLVYRFADDRARRNTSAVMGTLAVAAPIVVIMAQQLAAMLAGALVAACALGYAGSAAHAGLARKFARNARLPHVVALSYAAGAAMQLVNNVVVPGEVPSQFIFMVVDIAMVAMLHEQGDRWADTRRARIAAGIAPDADRHATAADRVLAGRLMVATACLAGTFGLLDGVLTSSGAPGVLGLGAGARLVLIVGTVVAGLLCGLRTRAARMAVPLVAGALATAGLLTTAGGIAAWAPVALLGVGSGFLVVFFTTAFMELSPRMHMAELWPVMGCAVAYGAGVTGALAGVSIAVATGTLAAAIAGTALFAVAAVALHGCAGERALEDQVSVAAQEPCEQAAGKSDGPVVAAPGEQVSSEPGQAAPVGVNGSTPRPTLVAEPASADALPRSVPASPIAAVASQASSASQPAQPPAKPSFADRVARYGEANDLTPRECEILAELLVSDDSMQEIAGRLYLSRSTLYRHIATMNKKTGTSSRAGLLKAFWLWDERR